MNLPKVFICILNWNGLQDTLECLDSLSIMDYSNFEIIVVDNGSKDDSVAVIKKNWANVTLIENKKNVGYAEGNNIAISHAIKHGAQYLWLLNNDTIVEKDALSLLVDAAEKHPDIGLMSPVIYYYHHPDEVQFEGNDADWSDFCLTKNKMDLRDSKNMIVSPSVWGTALLIKRVVIDKIGFLDPKYFAYAEDNDYSMRAVKAGFTNIILKSSKIYHKDSRSLSGQNSPHKFFLRTRNMYLFRMKYLKSFRRVKFFFKYIGFIISYAELLREQHAFEASIACLDGLWSGIYGMGGSWENRKKMPEILVKTFSFHPYGLSDLLNGNILSICSAFVKKIKAHSKKA